MVVRISSREARQGRKGVRLLIMLIAALILGLIAWVVLDFYYFSQGEKSLPAKSGQAQSTAHPAK